MTRDPEIQKSLSDLVEEFTIINIQMLDMAKPSIDKLTDKGLSMINTSIIKAIDNGINTLLNIIEAIISEIPIAGGIIALIIAIIRGINKAMLTASPGVEFSTESIITLIKNGFKMAKNVKRDKDILLEKGNNLKNTILGSKVANSVSNVANDVSNVYNNDTANDKDKYEAQQELEYKDKNKIIPTTDEMYDAVRYYRMFCTSNSPRCEEISETYKDNDNYKRLTEFPYEKFIKLYVENKNKSKKEGEKKLTVDEQIVIDDKEKQNIIKKRYDDAKY